MDLKSIEGNTDYNENEAKVKLFDRSSGTKYLTNTGLPVIVTWSLKGKVEKAVSQYGIVSANDAVERDPKSWKLYGKKQNDGDWNLIDEKTGQIFNARYQEKLYTISKPEEYSSYKLEITENYGNNNKMTQFADIILSTGKEEDNEFQSEGMNAAITNGPSSTWNQKAGAGWSGSKALRTSGSLTGEDAYSYNVIYDDLDIPVSGSTYLKYNIFPSMANGDVYDFQYTGMYMSIDLKFHDGTYLSEYGAYDQNENQLDPVSQGESRTLTTHQWNQIYSNIGAVAAGKRIQAILVDYKKPSHDMGELKDFITYFDDIEIYNKGEEIYSHLSDYTYILRGTNDSPTFSRGLTAPAVTMPHGFNFYAPATNSGDNKIYDYQDTSLRYMTISHEPSYWVGDRGTWQFMVNTSIDSSAAGTFGLGSLTSDFSHEKETAHAHYYSVEFDKEKGASKGSRLELTPTSHGAAVRFTFDKGVANRNVLLDCVRGTGGINFDNSGNVTTFTGYSDHTSNGSKRMHVYGTFNKKAKVTKTSGKAGLAGFHEDVVEMKIATSYISEEQAKKNLSLEIESGEDFDDVYNKAQRVWDEKLNIISDVKGAAYEQLVSLYSNIYRLFAYPNSMSENTGTNDNPVWKYKSPYRDTSAEPVEGEIYINNGFWDTYRTTWAAYGLFTPTKATGMLNGLVQHYKDQGWVPRWIAPGGTNSMVGTSSDVIFADALSKGIHFDYENAYKSAIRNGATVSSNLTNGGRTKLDSSIFLGYTPGTGDEFSWSIEGYINDYGIAQMAKILAQKETDEGKKEEYNAEYQYYINRAKNYVKLFDGSGAASIDRWFKGKSASGEWNTSNYTDGKFDPFYWGANYTETNAYDMSVSIPQDGQGLANLYGGLEGLGEKLDSIFTTNGIYNGYGAVNSVGGIHEQKEAREVKLGQLGHSNQPAHHIPYMYNYAGQPWKTQEYVRDILDRCYAGSTFGQGYIGDEDNGEMSAWYIFSALGFYPLTMGSDEYAIGSPLFDEVTVNLEGGNSLKIIANNNSKENVYIQSMKLNGEEYTRSFLKHSDIANGGIIEFTMGDTKNTSWGTGENDLPSSLTPPGEKVMAYDDIIQPKADIVKNDNIPEGRIYKDCVSSTAADVAKLIDNTSATEAALDDETAICYSLDEGKKVEMFTVTSGKKEKAPSSFRLYGALSDGIWVELGNYKDQEFEWSQYTRPFRIKEELQKEYCHYKFVFSKGNVSEIELLSYDDGLKDREDLGNLITSAKGIDQSAMLSVLRDKLNEAITAAEEVYRTGTTEEEYTKAYNELKKAIEIVTGGVVNPYDKIEAESFTNGNVVIDYKDGVPHNIGGVQANYWASYENVLFDGGSNFVEMCYSAQGKDGGGYVEIYLDSKESEPVGIIETPATTPQVGWDTYATVSAVLPNTISGLHDIYLVFRNDGSHAYVANVDWFKFTKTSYSSAVINPADVTYDRENPSDIAVSIQWNDAEKVEDVLAEGISVEEDSYVVSEGAITISKEYLDTLSLGNHELVVVFDKGDAAVLTIEVVEGTTPVKGSAVVHPERVKVDKKILGEDGLTFTINWNDAARVEDITREGDSIGEGAYTVSGSALTLSRDYLTDLPVGTHVLTVEFDAGEDAIITIELADSKKPDPSPGSPSSSSGTPQTKVEPLMIGNHNATGWNAILGAIALEKEESKVTIQMNDYTILPKEVLASLKEKNITAAFLMNGYQWVINGKDITEEAEKDVNLSIAFRDGVIEKKAIQEITGEGKTKQLQLAHNGNFGCTSVLEINLGKENGGMVANLFHQDPVTHKLLLQDVGKLDTDGNGRFSFLKGGNYVMIFTDKVLLENEIESILVTPVNKVLYVGGTAGKTTTQYIQLPEVVQKAVNEKLSIMNVTYRSANKRIASVSNNGRITGKGIGTTVIKTEVTIDGITKTYNTTIKVAKPYIKFTKTTSSLKLGEAFTFTVQCYGYDPSDVVFTTAKRSKVVIGKRSGKAVGKSKGIDYVIATCDMLKKKTKVTVK